MSMIAHATRFASFAAEAKGEAEQRVASSWEKTPGRAMLISTQLTTLANVSAFERAGDRQLHEAYAMLTPRTVVAGSTAEGTIKLHAEDIRSGPPLRLLVNLIFW